MSDPRRPPPLAPADATGMAAAYHQAQRGDAVGEVPVGAVVMREGVIIAQAHNETEVRNDPTAHAELLVIQRALGALEIDRLADCTLYVTLEPCAQCAGAIVLAKVGRLVFGTFDDKAGMCGSVGDVVRHPNLNHAVQVLGGVDPRGGEILRTFFARRR